MDPSRGYPWFCDAPWGHLEDRTEEDFCMFAETFPDVPIWNRKEEKWASEDFF